MSEHHPPYAVIGDPVHHSYSPHLHGALFSMLKQDEDYVAIQVRRPELARFVETARSEKRPGWNVTLPHKVDILQHLDEVSPEAWKVGAVNTVINRGGLLTGHNTDVTGFIMALDRAGIESTRRVVLLGAGGAARAAITALATRDTRIIDCFNQSDHRGSRLEEDFARLESLSLTRHAWDESIIEEKLAEADILINATPVGLIPRINDSPLTQAEIIPESVTVFDMNPSVAPSRLLRQAMARGCRVVEGVSMLVGQAIAAQNIWQDREMPAHCFDALLDEMKRKAACLYAY